MNILSYKQLIRHDLFRYFVASLIALAVDTATLSGCLRGLHLSLAWAASIGFVAGAVVAYLLSVNWVFRERAFAKAPAVEFLTFVAIGVAGLGLTQLILWLGAIQLGFMPELVKVSAAGVTFAFNYIARKSLLFASSLRGDTTQRELI